MVRTGQVGQAGALRTIGELAGNAAKNLAQWSRAIAVPPPASVFRPTPLGMIVTVVTLAAVIVSMFTIDAAASEWARQLPPSFTDAFRQITKFGLSGWFLIPFAAVLIYLAAVTSTALARFSRGVLTALAVRFGFLFLAIGVPGLFVAIVKRLIGRARPYVGAHDDPFAYLPFVWRPDHASMPSGHATTAVAAAIAIGAIWPRTRVVMWIYALIIMFSRVVVLEHHPSDVIAGALTGAAGAYLIRRWFAARRLGFGARTLRAYPGPSWRQITAALHDSLRQPR